MDELKAKIDKMPRWVQDYIKRLESLPDVLVDECAALRKKNDKLVEDNRRLRSTLEAMIELFRCAALGGNDGAKKVVDVLSGYEIFPKEVNDV